MRPDFTKQHKELFYQVMTLRKDIIGVADKKQSNFSTTIGVQLKVIKFIRQLKKKRESRLLRKSTLGVTMAQQAYTKLQANELAVRIVQKGITK